AVRARRDRSVQEVDTFLHRATTEGLLRPDQPAGWAGALLPQLMHLVARQMPQLSAARAADIVVDTFLHGMGAGRPGPTAP
ncbi:TetR family transcriptional regulator, partial [Streptomyces sp. NPDC006743]